METTATEDERLLAPPSGLISRNPMQWLRFFGPGAIVASLNIGSGEVLFPSRSGAIFGYQLLWIFLVFSVLKWVLAYSSMRHMILSGAHPYERWSAIPGPRGWLPLFIFSIAVIFDPVWFSFLSGLLGTLCTWIFGFGDHFWWATVCVGASLVLLALGGYRFLEKAQLVMLGLMLVCIFVAVAYVRPDWLAVAKGLFFPQQLVYPDWLFDKLPHMRDRSWLVEVSVYAAAIGGAGYDYLGYVSLLRDKKWGRSHRGIANQEELEQIAQRTDHPIRLWVRAALIDTVASFVSIVLIAGCFAILGTVLLQPHQLVPDGVDLLNHQATFLTTLSPLLLPLYQISVFFAFFGSIYGGPELAYRVVHEYLRTLPRWRDRLSPAKLRWVIIIWSLGGGLAVLWLSRPYPEIQLIDLITPAGICTGVLLCGFFCLANPWMDWHFLPRPLRMSTSLVVLNILAGIIFAVMGLWALWEYKKGWAFLMVAVPLLGAMFLTWKLRFFHPQASGPQEAETDESG